MGEELEMFARKETQKDVIVPKKVGEPLGVVVVESGWGRLVSFFASIFLHNKLSVCCPP